MTTKKNEHSTDSRASKRARFSPAESKKVPAREKPQAGASPLVLIAGLAIVVVLVGGMALALGRPGPAPALQSQPKIGSDSFGLPLGNAPAADATQAGVESGSAQSSGSQSAGAPAQPAAAAPAAMQAATLGHDPYPLVVAEDGAVRLPISTFDDGQAHFYTYVVNGTPIEFFAVKAGDGQIRAAFNACDVCFSAKRGYLQDGDVMVCQNCGSRFPLDKINFVRGGCNPSPLTRTVVGDTLVILESDLAQGLQYF